MSLGKTLYAYFPLGSSSLSVVVVLPHKRLTNRTQKKMLCVGVVRQTQSAVAHKKKIAPTATFWQEQLQYAEFSLLMNYYNFAWNAFITFSFCRRFCGMLRFIKYCIENLTSYWCRIRKSFCITFIPTSITWSSNLKCKLKLEKL